MFKQVATYIKKGTLEKKMTFSDLSPFGVFLTVTSLVSRIQLTN